MRVKIIMIMKTAYGYFEKEHGTREKEKEKKKKKKHKLFSRTKLKPVYQT